MTAFIVDGWVEMARADEVNSASHPFARLLTLNPSRLNLAAVMDMRTTAPSEMPPIAYQDRTASKPMELLTDAVGRPGYGRIDPTLFMFVTHPIFFGLIWAIWHTVWSHRTGCVCHEPCWQQ